MNIGALLRYYRKLKNLRIFDKDKYVRSLGSYKGYLDKSNTKLKNNYQLWEQNEKKLRKKCAWNVILVCYNMVKSKKETEKRLF